MARPLITKLDKLSSVGSVLAGGAAGGGLALARAANKEHALRVQEDRASAGAPTDVSDRFKAQAHKDRAKRLIKSTALGAVAGAGVGYGASRASKVVKGHLDHARTTVQEANAAATKLESGVARAEKVRDSVVKLHPKNWFKKTPKPAAPAATPKK
jgi:hypothetical protein